MLSPMPSAAGWSESVFRADAFTSNHCDGVVFLDDFNDNVRACFDPTIIGLPISVNTSHACP